MTQTKTDSVLALSGFPPLVRNVPPNWPQEPTPNKLSLLWQYNYHNLYHQYSPFTNYHENVLSGLLSDKQPFVYTYIDEIDRGIRGLSTVNKALLATVNIQQDTVSDVIRIAKWQVSSWGVQFLAKQALIQRLQPFDETRIYNPLSPILATIRPFALGIGEQPMRHIEGGVLGFANSITSTIGINLLGRGFTTPSSTVGDRALSDYNTGQGKGLVRGGTATEAYANLIKVWPGPDTSFGGIGFQGLLAKAKVAVNKMFGSANQPADTQVRADEGTYGKMVVSSRLFPMQPWYPMRETKIDAPKRNQSLLSSLNNVSSTAMGIISNPKQLIGMGLNALFNMAGTGNGVGIFYGKKIIALPEGQFIYVETKQGINGTPIKGRSVGYEIQGNKYGDNIKVVGDGNLENSDMLLQFSLYQNEDYNYESKFTEPNVQKVKTLQDTLKSVAGNINSNQTIYTAKTTTYSKLLSSGDLKAIGYDNMFANVPSTPSPINTYGSVKEYSTGDGKLPPTLDKKVNANKNLKFATTFTSDGLNQLEILQRDQQGRLKIPYDGNIRDVHGNWYEYKPYEDDLIAFFFYDVVNKKYIPFRATIKGISEGNTAFWDELRFIGRADQLYSYNGFSRTLSFGFNVVVNSISELLPCWKRINYLASIVKPSNYTRSENVNNVFNRFMVPPMFMITIGDLYKFQPIVIRSVTVNIPDDALWETLNSDNSTEWSYLNGIIKNPKVGNRYGQLPREVEINIEGALLEKERAQVGGSHYGHAPRKDNWEDFLNNGELTEESFLVGVAGTESEYYLPKPSNLHKQMIEASPSANPK